MGKFSEIDADIWSANDNYYGYVGTQGNPEIEQVHILVEYTDFTQKIKNLCAYLTYKEALLAKQEADIKEKNNIYGEHSKEYFIETIQVKYS